MRSHFAGRTKGFESGSLVAGHTENYAVDCREADQESHWRTVVVATVWHQRPDRPKTCQLFNAIQCEAR